MEEREPDTIEGLRHKILANEISHLRETNEKDSTLVWSAIKELKELITSIENDRNKLIGALVILSFILSIASGLIINYFSQKF